MSKSELNPVEMIEEAGRIRVLGRKLQKDADHYSAYRKAFDLAAALEDIAGKLLVQNVQDTIGGK